MEKVKLQSQELDKKERTRKIRENLNATPRGRGEKDPFQIEKQM